jgi:hypothetical protein
MGCVMIGDADGDVRSFEYVYCTDEHAQHGADSLNKGIYLLTLAMMLHRACSC